MEGPLIKPIYTLVGIGYISPLKGILGGLNSEGPSIPRVPTFSLKGGDTNFGWPTVSSDFVVPRETGCFWWNQNRLQFCKTRPEAIRVIISFVWLKPVSAPIPNSTFPWFVLVCSSRSLPSGCKSVRTPIASYKLEIFTLGFILSGFTSEVFHPRPKWFTSPDPDIL